MTSTRIWSLIVVLTAALVVLVPWVFFPVCKSPFHGSGIAIPAGMHGCTGTLKAETILGLLGIMAGMMPLLDKRRKVLPASAVAALVIGILIVLVPTVITGVCMSAAMPCVYGTRPALLVIGCCMALLGLAGMVLATKAA